MNDAIPSSGPITTQVYPAISHAEFGRLLAKYGYDAEPVNEADRIGYRTLTQPTFTAWMQTPFKLRADEFAAVFLFARYSLPAALSAAVLQAMRGKAMCAHLDMRRDGGLFADHTLVVLGGITEYHLRSQLWYWKRDLQELRREIHRQCRLMLGTTVH